MSRYDYGRPIDPSGSHTCVFTTKRRTWKWFGGKVSSSWTGDSKFTKRAYNKAFRRQGKLECRGIRPKGIAGKVTEVKYKGW